MKKHIALLLAVVLLLSACSTAQLDRTGAEETNNTVLETQNGTIDTTEGTTTTEGSEEISSTETTQGNESTQPTQGNTQPTEGCATTPNTGNSTPTQGDTKPTTGNTKPTQGATTTPTSTGTTPTGPITKPTSPTQPTNPTTPTQPTTPTTPTQPAVSLKINTANWTIVFLGETLQIDYTYTGSKSLTWSSWDTYIFTVDNNGVVTGKSTGSTTVEVTDGELTARVKITVSDAPKTTEIGEISHNAPLYDGVVKYAGDYMSFKVITRPFGSNPEVTVTSSNTSVVSVSYEMNYQNITHITLNFKSAGTAKVTITSGDGCCSKSYNITVKGDYACNPGSGQLTPEQFVNAYNGVVSANGMSTSVVSGYLVLTLSDSELTWSTARRNAESAFHHWYSVGKSYLSLTYEGTNAYGSHIFHVHR